MGNLQCITRTGNARALIRTLIEITVDGHISGDKLADFVYIQQELEKISIAVEALQLWCERMLDKRRLHSWRAKKEKAVAEISAMDAKIEELLVNG